MSEVLPGHIGGMSETVDGVIIDNRTGMDDDAIRDAVMAHWVETAAFQFGQPSTFQMYSNNPEGSLLARQPFQVPKDIIEEIRLARSLADMDDDIRATIGQMIGAAYRDGMQHQHKDEQTAALFNEWACDVNLDGLFKELHREYLIAGSVTTLSLFQRKRYSFFPEDTDTQVDAQIAVPLVGILPAEMVRVIETDLFGNGKLALHVENQQMAQWLDEFFNERTTVARKAQMARQNPVIAAMFTGRIEIPWNDPDLSIAGKVLYTLNDRMVKRTTMPKGAAPYPRPLLTSNFALLEAKRLLNVMDYALLQGGTNYIVVAKQGSDKLPAQQPEIDNLMGQIRVASRSGVLVGDHRIQVEIITPKLDELLNPQKRQMVGRKITQALLRIPSQVTEEGGTEGIKAEMGLAENTITSDRLDIRRHVENGIYEDIASRNPAKFKRRAPKIWFPRVILTDQATFYDAVLKTRDRGDIPRKWSVELLGYDFEAGVEQRKREKAAGLDDLMQPGNVPFSSPDAGPQDNGPGRPRGSSPNNGNNNPPDQPAPARPRRTITRTPGETIRAQWDATAERTLRVGETTETLLQQYPDFTVGRITQFERDAAVAVTVAQRGATAVVPVNLGYQVDGLRVLRLDEGLSLIVGQRLEDEAMVAKALCFREPHWTLNEAEDTARRWGFEPGPREGEIPEELAAVATEGLSSEELMAKMVESMTTAMSQVIQNLPVPQIYLSAGDKPRKMRLIRDEETGQVIGSEPVPEDE